MTSIDHVPVPPTPPIYELPLPGARRRRSASLAMAGILIGVVAFGAGGLAVATGMDPMAWRQGATLALVQRVVAHTLDSVGASADQEAKIHDIIASKFEKIAPNPEEHEAMRKQALNLLAAPTIDRAAVEKLRAEAVAKFDDKSKAFVGGVEEIADQLTPEQRVKLADELAQLRPHGPMGFEPGRLGAPDTQPDKD
jgi:Spy/CpxP family protein refolding chaperone